MLNFILFTYISSYKQVNVDIYIFEGKGRYKCYRNVGPCLNCRTDSQHEHQFQNEKYFYAKKLLTLQKQPCIKITVTYSCSTAGKTDKLKQKKKN